MEREVLYKIFKGIHTDSELKAARCWTTYSGDTHPVIPVICTHSLD